VIPICTQKVRHNDLSVRDEKARIPVRIIQHEITRVSRERRDQGHPDACDACHAENRVVEFADCRLSAGHLPRQLDRQGHFHILFSR